MLARLEQRYADPGYCGRWTFHEEAFEHCDRLVAHHTDLPRAEMAGPPPSRPHEDLGTGEDPTEHGWEPSARLTGRSRR